ncbi:rhamnogalacturonan endolyase family protein [Maribellus maritimus]|uniref:rhamnogalacturonan endolyase family protein n=1 Tax=Maribellus maritimus TaxID=2870838 RepID=UPI001EEA6E70|nr:hypothetical protein [Maribellus maritimus]MCG6185882.1 hypothetical protein [Maribellus maritimus]
MEKTSLHLAAFAIVWFSKNGTFAQIIMGNPDRGAIAVKNADSIFLSWRLLGNDSKNTAFNIYRIN